MVQVVAAIQKSGGKMYSWMYVSKNEELHIFKRRKPVVFTTSWPLKTTPIQKSAKVINFHNYERKENATPFILCSTVQCENFSSESRVTVDFFLFA